MTLAAAWAARVAVAAMFAVAAWAKLAHRDGTRQAVQDFGVPATAAPAVATALPVLEAVVAVAVLLPASAVVGCVVALVLLAAFTVAVAVQLRRGRHPSCSCFGSASTVPVSGRTLARNAGVAVLIAGALWGSWAHEGLPGALPDVQAAGIAAVVVLAAAQAWQVARMRVLREELEDVRASLPRDEILPIGTTAPEFDLPAVDGGRGTLAKLIEAGRPLALVFLHPDCGPCQGIVEEFPALRSRHYGTLTLVPIGSGDMAANSAWAHDHELGPMLVQSGNEVGIRYRLRGTPSAVLIDTRGRIASRPARGPTEVRQLLSDPTTRSKGAPP